MSSSITGLVPCTLFKAWCGCGYSKIKKRGGELTEKLKVLQVRESIQHHTCDIVHCAVNSLFFLDTSAF